MPGVKGRSGRRAIAKVPKGFRLPPLGDDEPSVRAYVRAVARALERGEIDPRVADSFEKLAGRALTSIRDEKDRGKNERLNKLEAIVESLEVAGVENEVAERQRKRG